MAAHNLVSHSSARVCRLQQGMLGMAAQRPLVRGEDGHLQVRIHFYIFTGSDLCF